MPWTISDVSRFKSGLTDAQKRRWVRIANSALAACQSRGGSNCEASAIRQASGVVGNIKGMERYIQVNTDYDIRTETIEGVDHIVVPVVMMVEGVHNGSAGALLHLTEDLGKFPEAWNGMPVTIQHPTEDGHNVSANSPEVIASQSVGRIYNTHMDNGKLKAEVWLDEARLQRLSPEALTYIQRGDELQVSIGVFTDEDNTPGEFRGVPYEAIARNHRPDHLALLPGAEGACSWDDGCGIRANKKKGGKDVKKAELDLHQVTMYDSQKTIVDHITDNKNGYREMIQLVQAELDSMDTQVKYYYLAELYEDQLIYEIRMQGEGTTYYQQNYTISNNDEVEFSGDPVEVRREVDFVVMKSSGFTRTKFNNQSKKEVKTMSDKKEAPCKKVDELINHKLTKFTEESRGWLSTLEESVLDTLIPNEPEVEKVEAPQVDAAQAIQVLKDQISKPEDFFKVLPEEMQDSMRAGLKLHEEQREKMIKGILDNVKDVWTEDELKAMNTDTLKKVFDSVPAGESDFSILGDNKLQDNKEKPGFLFPPGVKEEEVKTETK